jgi:uncharacterized membrane protein
MHPHPQASTAAGGLDRAGVDASPSGPSGRRWLGRIRPTAFKPLTYSAMHLTVAIAVAFVLTRDWRIALGVGVIEPMVQTVAYMIHEKVWALGGLKSPAD